MERTGTIEGVQYRLTSDGGAKWETRYLIDGEWMSGGAVEVQGPMNDQAETAVADQGWSVVKRLADFTPWEGNSHSLRFNVSVDGVRRDARVTRECLNDNHLVDWAAGREVFADGPHAQRLRVIAQGMLRQQGQALIKTEDWL